MNFVTHPIRKEEFKSTHKIGRRVFRSLGKIYGYKNIFSSRINHKFILYECSHFPDKEIVDAILSISSEINDRGIYMSCRSAEPKICNENGEFENWYIRLEDMSEVEADAANPIYKMASGYGAAQFYSPQGLWGLMTDYDYFGVFGGSDEIVKQIHEVIPNLDIQLFNFLEEMKRYELKTFWLCDLLSHIYGKKKCRELMQAYKFPSIYIR